MGANRSKSAGQESSEVLEAAPGRMPKVRAPDSPLVFWGGLGGAVLAGLLVFNGMNTARGARAQTPPPHADLQCYDVIRDSRRGLVG